MTDFFMLIMAFRVSIFVFIVPMLMKEFGQKNKNKIFAAMICHNDELTSSWLDLIVY